MLAISSFKKTLLNVITIAYKSKVLLSNNRITKGNTKAIAIESERYPLRASKRSKRTLAILRASKP